MRAPKLVLGLVRAPREGCDIWELLDMLSQFQSSGLVTGRCWREQGLEEDGCGWKTGLTSG